MKLYYEFTSHNLPDIQEVGGKAQSLIKLTQGGFNVPYGAVLTVSFFNEWLTQLKNKEYFRAGSMDPNKFESLAAQLKDDAGKMTFTDKQKEVIDQIMTLLDGDLFAVRSSSPEEDLSGASFAGGYETVLGVTPGNIMTAIKSAFVSCLDERVFFYKHHNGFDTSVLRIAVIIQIQLNSTTSGVAFSLNPLNNCYDEAVINANAGLGESVVSGMVTPDEFVVNKVTKDIVEKTVGVKEQFIELLPEGGTKVVDQKATDFCINSTQVVELVRQTSAIEGYYQQPMDIEWAYEGKDLYILQARPITTFVPLPKEMQTGYDEQPILYLDGSLTKQGITEPISFLGCEVLALTQSAMFKRMLGKDCSQDVKGGLATTRGGRMYLNASSTIKFQSLDRVINAWETADAGTAELMRSLDLNHYIPEKLPEAMKGLKWGAIKNNFGAIGGTIRAARKPEAYKAWYQPKEDAFDAYLKEISMNLQDHIKTGSRPLSLLFNEIMDGYYKLLDIMLPMTYAAEISRRNIEKLLKKYDDDHENTLQYLQRSLPDNTTIDMGLAMYDFSQKPEVKENTYSQFSEKLSNGTFSNDFITQWHDYLDQYGFRTNKELDIAVIRPKENAEVLFDQIKLMTDIDEAYSPVTIYNTSMDLRKETYSKLMATLPTRAKKRLKKQYHILVTHGGKREALKYWYAKSLAVMRELLVAKASLLVKEHHLRSAEDIYSLTLSQIERVHKAPEEMIHEWLKENRAYYQLLDRVHDFPKLIDSRGRILRPPMKERQEDQLVGQPISPGLVVGRVKTLSDPKEKPLYKGEILVTRATDPGWTPLFINASAILLEVGGLLQHGSLVAREYGKPCIAGIDNLMHELHDGQLIEVDAAQGTIQILEE